MSGEGIGLGDLVAYYVDAQDIRPGYTAVGKNVMVSKECEEVLEKEDKQGRRRRRKQSTEKSAGAEYAVGMTSGDDVEAKEVDDDDRPDEDISDGELDWLEIDIGTMIAKEDPQAKTLKLLTDVRTQLKSVRATKVSSKNGNKITFRAGYTVMANNSNSFWRMKKMLANLEARYNSQSDLDYEPGDEVEVVTRPRQDSETAESSFTSMGDCSNSVEERRRRHLISTASTGSVDKRSDRIRAESGGIQLPFWVRAVSVPEKYDPEMEKFVPIDKSYSEERDPDYSLPETDTEVNDSEDEDVELDILVKEANEEIPTELKEWKAKSGSKVVSPVKVILTPNKEGDEEPKDEIVTLDSEDEVLPKLTKDVTPKLWEKELLFTEQPEEYDSADDPEFVPQVVIYETENEYDEYSDGGDVIPDDEVIELQKEQELPVIPPSNYIPIWIPISSPAEKIARAKEELKASGVADEDSYKDETSVKDTDSNGKKVDEAHNVTQLQDDVIGLAPNNKKVAVESTRTSSEDGYSNCNLPKPKRERKKSKNKAKSEDGVKGEESAAMAGGAETAVTAGGEVSAGTTGGEETSAAEVGNVENVVDEKGDAADALLEAVQ